MTDTARTKILVVATMPPDLRARLSAAYELVDLAELKGKAGALPLDLSGFRIVLTMSLVGADEALMDAMPDLGMIACNGAGLDKIDLAAAARRNIVVCHTPDELTEDVADFGIGLIYAVSRRLVEADRFVRSGRWPTTRMTPSRSLVGKTLGIIGLGKIGSAVARRAAGLGMSVIYHGRRERRGSGYAFEPALANLAERADIVILCCAGGEATRHLVRADFLERLGPDGILVNISRGSVVDEGALLDALERATIAGAALDVFAAEPRIDERFMRLENVVVAPHYASLTFETRAAMIARIDREIGAYLQGGPLHDAAKGHAEGPPHA